MWYTRFILLLCENSQNHNTNVICNNGAHPRYSLNVRTFLNNAFNEWIKSRGTTDRPSRSCDLTTVDFSVWWIVKTISLTFRWKARRCAAVEQPSLKNLKGLIITKIYVKRFFQVCENNVRGWWKAFLTIYV